MKEYDVIVIGGGIIGSNVANTLTENSLKVALIEKECDIAASGATKANSGIIHGGFDCTTGTLKAKLNVEGSKMYPKLAKRLGVEVVNCGALVVGRENELDKILQLFHQGVANGVEGLSIIKRDEILKYLPTAHEEIALALLVKTSSIVSPYLMAIALAEEAKINGCDFYFESQVTVIEKIEGKFHVTAGANKLVSKVLINSAGANSKEMNRLAKAEDFPLRFARGEYMLLDLTEKGFVKSTIFPLPTKLGKGVLITPTVHGNIIVGPTAIDCEAEENIISQTGLDYLRTNAQLVAKDINYRKNIRVFSGTRAISGEDFIIEKSQLQPNFIYLGGICSPGLSSSPAIATYVAELVSSLGVVLKEKEMQPRVPYHNTCEMSDVQLNELIAQNESFGKIVCRCEKITEGEILEAVNSPLRPKTVDGVKRRVRAGMGRCQGGFCMPRVIDIIANENGMSAEDVTKSGGNSTILLKEGN